MIRKNFLTGEYVVFSLDRANRPRDMKRNIVITPKNRCPFCEENSHLIEKPLYKRYNNQIKLIRNKYPILSSGEDYGVHFVLIDTKEHNKNLVHFDLEHMYNIIKSMQDILNMLVIDKDLRYVQIFKNQGINAGASQSHSHWQIIGLPMLPNKQKYMIERLKDYEGKCYFCEIDYIKNLVYENEYFVAFCPEDSLYCYEVDIMPKGHITSIIYLNEIELKALAQALSISLRKLNKLYEDLDYNICFYNSFRKEDEYHFFIQIIPRMGNMAGFEFSTGMFVNSVLPNLASENLRAIKL